MKIYILILLVILSHLTIGSLVAQVQQKESFELPQRPRIRYKTIDKKPIRLEGVVKKKMWSKSLKSYCAQGSDYIVLQTKDKEYVLEFKNDEMKSKYSNGRKNVKLKGKRMVKIIPTSKNPMEQHPVSYGDKDEFSCEIFRVLP
ncbi:MAG: hypothetical protein H7A23_19495 [Leptospiraceae bacterium]|nr:hypothetical protein [Leptospiraceae bacterium]MCP5496740.1 hypothetical protein [Leptospiraceae bacterium]